MLLHVALMTLALTVIGLTIKGREDLTARRREVAELIPGGTLEAKSLVGVGVVLIITCIQICILAVWRLLPFYDSPSEKQGPS